MSYFNSGFMNIAGKKCLGTDDKLHKPLDELVTKYCLQLRQEICLIRTTSSTSFQNKEKDLECALITTYSGFIKTAGRN